MSPNIREMKKVLYWIVCCLCCSQLWAQQTAIEDFLFRLKSFDSSITQTQIDAELQGVAVLSDSLKAELYTELGNFYYVVKRDNEAAFRNFYLALENEAIASYTQANAYNGIGVIFKEYHQTTIAEEKYRKALAIMQKKHADSISDIASVYNNLGNLYEDANLRDSAYAYYKKGINLGDAHQQPAVGCLFNLGHLLLSRDSSYYYTKRALDHVVAKNDSLMMTLCWLNLGVIETDAGNLQAADSLLTLSKRSAKNNGQEAYLHEVDMYRGYWEVRKGTLVSGIEKIEKELPFFEQRKDYAQLKKAYEVLEQAYVKVGDYKKAYGTSKAFLQLGSTQKKQRKLVVEQGIPLLKSYQKLLENQRVRQHKNRKFLPIAIASLLIGMLLGVLFFIHFKQRKKEEVLDMEKKNNELSSDVVELIDESKQITHELLLKSIVISEKQSFLKSLLEKLKEQMRLAKGQREKEFLQSLYKEIQMNRQEHLEKEFEVVFGKTHPNFFSKIQEKGFVLTSNEMKLAALVRLNFSTREISEITKKTPNTVNVGKTRLKSKLQLTKEDSLCSFLQNIDR